MTVQEAFDGFILSRRLKDLSEKSIEDYTSFIGPLVREIGPDTDFKDVTREMINKYIITVLKRSLARSSKATYIRHAKIYLCWCEQQCGININASSIDVPKTPKKVAKIYSEDEIVLLFDSIKAENKWLTVRNKCMVALMYDSGIRRGEVCSLKRADISFTECLLKVHGKGDKERVVPLGNLSRRFIEEYLRLCPYHSENLFVGRRGRLVSENTVKQMIAKLGRLLPFKISCHLFRHNFATNYCIDQLTVKGDCNIYSLKYIMGHENIETTEKYLHFAYELLASAGHISHLDKMVDKIQDF